MNFSKEDITVNNLFIHGVVCRYGALLACITRMISLRRIEITIRCADIIFVSARSSQCSMPVIKYKTYNPDDSESWRILHPVIEQWHSIITPDNFLLSHLRFSLAAVQDEDAIQRNGARRAFLARCDYLG